MYTRGEGVAQDYAAAVDWYRRAAAQGFAKAITNLGVMLENGFGVPQDEDEARRLYRLGGRQDSAEAALDQARFVDSGNVPPADPRALAAAAERGDADAQFDLGLRYVRGLGVPQDYVLAYMWLNLAAARGRADAVKLRDALGGKLTAAQTNEAQRLARARWNKE
jgi:TPR repeat protein